MHLLITGGAGFIGSNLADHFLREGYEVTIFDNLSRSGVERNLDWLKANHSKRLRIAKGDVREFDAVRAVVGAADMIFHLAAQVAVTTSVADPRTDFEINALGTFNVLEAARQSGRNPVLLFTSTNKVYGSLEHLQTVEEETCYRLVDCPDGIPETCPLDFHSPYGCSKGTADQYVRDYARIYGLRSVVFRMSCIYGPRQFGTEDQGWVAYFIIAHQFGRPITIYGNGKQVRDILFVSDLVRAFALATHRIDTTAGQVYNIGGGPGNTLSIWKEFQPLLAELTGRQVPVVHGDWRPGDQPIYVSDTRKAVQDFGWAPTVGVREGIARLSAWVSENSGLFE
jgi:CDP-paratose 2-epimerase